MTNAAHPSDRKTGFLRAYANLPDAVRDDVVAVIDNEPYTWRSAKIEIEEETTLGNRILESLATLDILP